MDRQFWEEFRSTVGQMEDRKLTIDDLKSLLMYKLSAFAAIQGGDTNDSEQPVTLKVYTNRWPQFKEFLLHVSQDDAQDT